VEVLAYDQHNGTANSPQCAAELYLLYRRFASATHVLSAHSGSPGAGLLPSGLSFQGTQCLPLASHHWRRATRMAGAFSANRNAPMDTALPAGSSTTPEHQQSQTVEVRARIPAKLRDQLEQMAGRNFRSMAGEVAAACSAWVQQHGHAAFAAPLLISSSALLIASPTLAQTCGPLGSPDSLNGCVVPGRYGSPSIRIQSDPLNPGGFRSTPVSPSPSYPTNLPGGLNRNYSQPGVPGLY